MFIRSFRPLSAAVQSVEGCILLGSLLLVRSESTVCSFPYGLQAMVAGR